MAWHRHRMKRVKQNKRKNTQNVNTKRILKTLTKQLLALIKEKKLDEAKTHLKKTVKAYATSAKRGILHKNNASRHIGRLTKKVNALEVPAK
jgi:small subunit ribosomal protein S20